MQSTAPTLFCAGGKASCRARFRPILNKLSHGSRLPKIIRVRSWGSCFAGPALTVGRDSAESTLSLSLSPTIIHFHPRLRPSSLPRHLHSFPRPLLIFYMDPRLSSAPRFLRCSRPRTSSSASARISPSVLYERHLCRHLDP